jgi:hypothetical protein
MFGLDYSRYTMMGNIDRRDGRRGSKRGSKGVGLFFLYGKKEEANQRKKVRRFERATRGKDQPFDECEE